MENSDECFKAMVNARNAMDSGGNQLFYLE